MWQMGKRKEKVEFCQILLAVTTLPLFLKSIIKNKLMVKLFLSFINKMAYKIYLKEIKMEPLA